MLKTYLLTAYRTLIRNKSYTFLNVLGLSLGITCSILLFLVIKYELSFDKFHAKADRIYRVGTRVKIEGTPQDQVAIPVPATKLLRENNPGLEAITHIFGEEGGQITIPGKNGAEPQYFVEEGGVAFAEPDIFETFSFASVNPELRKTLAEPNTIILTRSLAKKYFPNSEAVGQIVRFNNKLTLKVTGVIPDLPVTTDLQFIMFISRPTLKDFFFYNIDSWNTTVSNQNLFVVLPEGVSQAEMERKINATLIPLTPKLKETTIFLQPLKDIHFNPDLGNYANRAITKEVIWAMTLIGIFLIITACINFINLATAQAIKRSKEVGMRKVLGSSYWHLILQFLGETFLITLTALLASIILTELALPLLNRLMELKITFSLIQDPVLLLFLVLELLIVTLFSGLYPAFILARFKPLAALKSKMSTQQVGGISLRQALVVVQFTICQILIICTLVVSEQMEYFRSKPLGFTKDAVIMLRLPMGHAEKLMAYRQELTKNPAIKEVSFALAAPTSDITSQSSFRFGNTQENMPFSASMKYTDEHYFSLFDLKFLAGRSFIKSDTIREVVINETMRRKLGLKSPEEAIGKKILLHSDVSKPIVGVVEDFHQNSLHKPIDPAIITSFSMAYYHLAVKIDPNQTEAAINHLETVWPKAYPDDVFNYRFLDESIKEFYQKEKRQFALFRIFSGIAILIGCLGLYGLVAFMAAQRTKEVGIRKVLGASLFNITMLFSKEFIKLVLIAFVIAAPLAWYLMSKWLQDFTYRINLGFGAFLLAGIITMSIALLTMSVQAIKAARRNPILALKTE